MVFEYFVFGVVPLICEKIKKIITKQMQKVGGRRTGLRKVKTQITIVRGSSKRVTLMKFKGLLRYHKPHVTDYKHLLIMFNTQTAYIAAYVGI